MESNLEQTQGLLPKEKGSIDRGELIVVSIVLLLVVVAWTVYSMLHPAITGGDLNLVATMVSKDLDPGLYPRDDIFVDDTFYRFYTPVYRWIVAQFWQLGGGFEWGLVYLTPLLLAIYLIGMFVLLRRVTGNSWLALGITVASANYYEAMGEELWGVGGSQYLMSRAVFTAVAPYLVIWFFSFLESPAWLKAAGLGLAIGLAANLHPISGWQFAGLILALMGGIYLLNRESWRQWLMLVVMVVAIGLGALPIVGSVFGNTGRGLPSQVTFEAFRQIIYEKYTIPFRPPAVEWNLAGLELNQSILEGLVWIYVGLTLLTLLIYFLGRDRWPKLIQWGGLAVSLLILFYAYLVALFNLTFFFVVVAGYLIYAFWRQRISPLDWILIGWMGLTVLASFVGYYFFMLAWETFELQSFIAIFTGQIRAARFIYLPLYLLLGRAGLAWVELGTGSLREHWERFKLGGHPPGENSLSLAVGGVFCLGPGLSKIFFTSLPLALVAVAGAIGGVLLVAWLLESDWVLRLGPWRIALGIIGLVLVLLGPLAPAVGPYLPIPAINTLDPEARIPEPIFSEDDRELYSWVRDNTAENALIYWCDFGPRTTLQFRRYAQRSINLNWKDLNLSVYDMASLIFYHERYRRLEAACDQFDSVVAAARSIEADYILTPPGRAVGLEHLSCFQNSRYVLFPVGTKRCVRQ